jgi:serine/threonine protein kinase
MQKYQILSQIGSGAYGRVFHCVHISTHVDYAVKRIFREEQPGISQNTLREISVIKALQRRPHENIVE